MLTPEKRADYIHHEYNHCPYCHSDNLDSGNRNGDGNTMAVAIHCDSCGRDWTDIYTLTGITEEEQS
jgi:transposase-like protein